MAVMDTFSKRLKALREEKKLSQTDLAKELGISRGSLSFYENAERTADIEVLYKVSDYFGVTLDYLLGKSDNRTRETADIGDITGLSDDAIHALEKMNADGNYYVIDDTESGQPIYWKKYMVILNCLLEDNKLPGIIDFMRDTIYENCMYTRLMKKIEDFEEERTILGIRTQHKERFEWASWKLEKESAEILRSVIDKITNITPNGFYDGKIKEGALNADNTEEE